WVSAVNPGVSVTTVTRDSWATSPASSTKPTPAFPSEGASLYCSVVQNVDRLPSVAFGASASCSPLLPNGSYAPTPLSATAAPTDAGPLVLPRSVSRPTTIAATASRP